MPVIALQLALGASLALAGALKLVRPAGRDALATFGIRSDRLRRVLWPALALGELALAAGVALGLAAAARAAAALMLAFALALAGALAAGRGGAPCACFGARSTVSRVAVARNAALAAALAALPLLPEARLSTQQWLGLGLAAALLGVVALAIALLALAREVGELRLRLGPQAALEIGHEGPELGSRSTLIERFAPAPDAELALAVFASEGCHLCRALEPAVAALGRDPRIALEVFDEHRDHDAWSALDVPGSPYAAALGLDGVVLAKGTFNSYGQLEGLLAAAERRERAAAHA